MALNHSQDKKVHHPTLYAQPILELLYSSAIMGEKFDRQPSATLPQTTFENATALFHFAALTVNQFKQATRKDRTPIQKECLRFLTDLRNDFEQIGINAAKGVSNG